MMNCCEKIRSLRKQYHYSQEQLAKLLQISNKAVSKWENGMSAPTVENLRRLSQVFHVSTDYLINNTEAASEPKGTVAGMKSIKELFKIGSGPSSSHAIGPERAVRYFLSVCPEAERYKVILFGSLAKTGSGHGTDRTIYKAFGQRPVEVEFNFDENDLPHPNTMLFYAYRNGSLLKRQRIFSIGGGDIKIEGVSAQKSEYIYEHTLFSDIVAYCRKNDVSLYEYIQQHEESDFGAYLLHVWRTMKKSIRDGLCASGILPGGLNIQRKAGFLYNQNHIDESAETRENRLVCAYAFAVSEENASGNTIVTAPTCGSAGIVPAVLYYYQQKRKLKDEDMIRPLAIGGLIGNLIKTNASISGAECGCQAEVGSACAMAAAMLGELLGMRIEQIEYAAEIAIEHHLGLTCDPVCGLVQIPCIERNAVAAMRAINAVNLANFLTETRKISLDTVIRTMKETGRDMSAKYRETSEGGLAHVYTK